MFAVVRSGGKQYRVAPEDVIQVERLKAEAGETIELGEVLAMSDGETVSLGQPLLDGARVAATVVEHKRGEKIIVFRKKRRKNYRRKRGHRQELTVLRIDEILAAGQKRRARRKKKTEAEGTDEAAGHQAEKDHQGQDRSQATNPENGRRQGREGRGRPARARRSD